LAAPSQSLVQQDEGASPVLQAVVSELSRKAPKVRPSLTRADERLAREALIETEHGG
jgi:hypothetical protein